MSQDNTHIIREPSIHITETQLKQIIEYLFPELEAGYFAHKIVHIAKSHSVTHRALLSSNQQIEKKADRIRLNSKSECGLFAQILLLVRRKLKHRGVQLIKPGSMEWFQLKETSVLATEFCNEFGLPLKEGYKIYTELSIPKMKFFSLNKFRYNHARVIEEYESSLEIQSDTNPTLTKQIHDYYMGIISQRTGNALGYDKEPNIYKYFVRVQKECHRLSIGYKAYIRAQFAGLDWASAIPEPSQLVGFKALDRMQKWAYENNIKIGAKETVIDFSKIKQNGNGVQGH